MSHVDSSPLSPGTAASASASASPPPPTNEVDQLRAQNAQMQAAGLALQQRVAALEAERVQLRQHLTSTAAQQTGSLGVAVVEQQGATAGGHGRPKGPTPPEFHGTKTGGYEIDAWIRDMKTQFAFYGVRVFPDDAAMVRHAAMFLKGRAAEWWEAEDKSTGVESSWDRFTERLRERYRPMQAAVVARERLRRLKQTGTVSSYADLFQKELTPIKDMSASDQIFNFVSGLASTLVANKVREKEPKSLHEAMDIAVRAEVFLAGGRHGHTGFGYGGRSSGSGGSSGALSSAPMEISALEDAEHSGGAGTGADFNEEQRGANAEAALMAKVEAMVQHRLAALMQKGTGDSRNDRVPGLKASDIEKLRAEGRCFRCKQKGHNKRDCPNGKPSFQ
jgi:hypothetical protein